MASISRDSKSFCGRGIFYEDGGHISCECIRKRLKEKGQKIRRELGKQVVRKKGWKEKEKQHLSKGVKKRIKERENKEKGKRRDGRGNGNKS